mgnify:CR=1 FL=1
MTEKAIDLILVQQQGWAKGKTKTLVSGKIIDGEEISGNFINAIDRLDEIKASNINADNKSCIGREVSVSIQFFVLQRT